MSLLFSYGTLQEPRVQLSTFGRRLIGTADALAGCVPASVPIDDAAVIAATGRTHHANVRFTGDAAARVDGTVFEVTDEELERADGYEAAFNYTRVHAPLVSGRHAWVYVAADGDTATGAG